MELEINFDRFKNLLGQMGAELVKWESSASHRKFKDVLQPKEFKIKSLKEIKFSDKAIFYKGEQVIIYIKHNKCYHRLRKYKNMKDYINSPDELNKIHYLDCTWIKEKKGDGSFGKYNATTRKDGLFLIDAEYEGKTINDIAVKLLPCQYCLNESNLHGFANLKEEDKKKFVHALNVKDILKDYGSKISKKPRHNEHTVPKNNYAKNWEKISRDVRGDDNWTCQKCKVNLSNKVHKKLLHVHHKNGNKWDNRYSNLQSLCILCHHEEHEHMGVNGGNNGGNKRIIEELRIMQRV